MEYKNVKFFQTRNIRMFETVKKSHLLVFNNKFKIGLSLFKINLLSTIFTISKSLSNVLLIYEF